MPLPLLSPLELFSSLTLKVWVKDASSQRYLSSAAVRVFVNGSLLQFSQTEENGEVLLTVPYQLGVTLTLVASMEAYVPSQLPWKTTKMPSESAAYIPPTWSFRNSCHRGRCLAYYFKTTALLKSGL